MAEEVKKAVLIRKKVEPQEQRPEEIKPVEVKVEGRKAPSEARRAYQKKRSAQWHAENPGLRHVHFVIEIELWGQFVTKCCTIQKPNTVFTRMIREAVDRHNKDSGTESVAAVGGEST